MGNDNKITPDSRELTHEAATIFIKEDITHNQPPELYDLDAEFANKRKNRSKITTVSLILFTFLFSLAAFIVTQYIEYQNSRIPISINAFEDVNLREIFDKAKQYENEMKDAVRDLDDIYTARDNALSQLRSDAENRIRIIEAGNSDNKSSLINRVNLELKETLETEEALWQEKADNAKEKIDSIQDKIDAYDTRILEKAKEQESIINNQQKRFDMEMEKSVQYYENKIQEINRDHITQINSINQVNRDLIATLRQSNKEYIESLEEKYNPEFDEEFSYIYGFNSEPGNFYMKERDIGSVIYEEGLITPDESSDIFRNIETSMETFKRLGEIPYYNSPKDAISYLEFRYYEFLNQYKKLIYGLTSLLEEKNMSISKRNFEISQMDYFLTRYLKTNRINGVIIDPRGRDIKVFIDPIYQIKNGTLGFVFRNDSDFIGTIKMRHINGDIVATIETLEDKDRGMNAFDKILINLK